MRRRRFTAIAVGMMTALAVLGTGPARAQAYPEKSIHLVVGFPPGGANDILARLIGQKLSERWNQPVIIDNKPGANAIIATEFVGRAAPDGYTLLIGASGAMTVNPGVYDKLPYDPIKDFDPVTFLASFPLIMAVNPDLPAKTIKDFVALAQSTPGKINYSSGSTPFQLATEMFKRAVGMEITHISYKGSAAAVTAVISGEAQFTTVDVPPAVQLVKAGKMRGLAVTGPHRVAELPDLPTLAEAGYPDIEVVLWTGLFAPHGTPRPVIDRLQATIAEILTLPDVKERLASLGFEGGGGPPEATAATVKHDLDKWVKVAKDANVHADR